MQILIDPIWEAFERTLYGELSGSEFEEWLYQHPGTEAIIGSDFYAALLAFDFHKKAAARSLRELILEIYNRIRPGRLYHDRARRLANGIIDGELDLLECIRGLASLRQQGNEWIPIEFVGIDSELDELPDPGRYYLWDRDALAEKIAESMVVIENHRVVATKAAKRMLREPDDTR